MICVDDEVRVMRYTVSICQNLEDIDDVRGFTHAREALDWVRDNPVDVALLDIDMPDMNGLALAARIKKRQPDCAIIFLTAYAQYALDSFSVHPTGYLLKPIDEADIAREVRYALSLRRAPVRASAPAGARIEVRTFGNFEILVDGETLRFRRAKCKELLAFLVDHQGQGVTRPEIYATLWEDGDYNHSQQKYLDVVIRSLRETLAAHGAEGILELKSGFLRIRPEMVSCDLYRFLAGDPAAVNAYRGKYMSSYPWAVFNEAQLTDTKGKISKV